MPSPEIFRIIFEEHGIQFAPETVDVKVFERLFLPFVEQRGKITETGLQSGDKPHVFEGFKFKGNRIIEKLSVKINAGHPMPAQHDAVFLLWVRAAHHKRHLAV